MKAIAIFISVVALSVCSLEGQTQPATVATLCQLTEHPARFSGKMVVVTAEIQQPRRVVLAETGCGEVHLVTPHDDEVRPKAKFHLVEDENYKLFLGSLSELVPPPEYKPGHIVGTFEGRFDSVLVQKGTRIVEANPREMRLPKDDTRLVLHRVIELKVDPSVPSTPR